MTYLPLYAGAMKVLIPTEVGKIFVAFFVYQGPPQKGDGML
jgi:hypothetical protein